MNIRGEPSTKQLGPLLMGHLRPSGLQSVLYMLVAEGEKVDMTHGVNSMLLPPQKQQQQQNNKQTKNADFLSAEKHPVAWVLNTIKSFSTLLGDVFLLHLSCLCNQYQFHTEGCGLVHENFTGRICLACTLLALCNVYSITAWQSCLHGEHTWKAPCHQF